MSRARVLADFVGGTSTISGAPTFTGAVSGAGSNIKEQLAMLCDGQNYVVGSGTYTPTVIYNFIFEFRQASTHHGIGHFKLFIDSDEVVDGRQGMSANSMLNTQLSYSYVIPIGGSADTDSGRLASWTSAKTLKMQGREYSSSNTVSLHNTYYWDGSASSQVRRPSLIITSIG